MTVSERLRYSMIIQWSPDDQAYLVTLPEWEGRIFNPVTHGETYEAAIKNGHEALEALVASAQKHGESLPEPRVFTVA
jgi:predicted RNase H-like HicB family nuclease